MSSRLIAFRPRTASSLPLVLAWLLLAAGCQAPPPLDTSQGVPWSLAEHRVATLSQLSYRIALKIPEERTAPIEGRTLIRLQWHDPAHQSLVVDFKDPGTRVHALTVNDSAAKWTPVNDHIVIPASELTDGYNEVSITYTAGDDALNRNPGFLYTLFVPDRAHYSVPLFDQPNLKAPVQWVLTLPGSWKAVSNAPVAERTLENGVQHVTFKPTRPLPTYLFAFAAGDFMEDSARVDGREMHMYHRETDSAKVARNRDAIFQLEGKALAWLQKYTGIPYPFQKFDFVLIPSFQYGGMEHAGQILYQQSSLMLDKAPTENQIIGRASVIAHETSHMWFGDLVTPTWFDDVWLKEVFANFMADKIVRLEFPHVNHDLRFLMAHYPAAYAVDRSRGANPMRQPLNNLDNAGSLYGSIIYEKAPIVMRHLETRVGKATFQEGLREYLKGHEYGNATWTDLIDILDRLSPQDLKAWSHVWVEEPGRPTITVTREGSDVVIAQSDPAGKGRVWPQTLHVRLDYAGRDTLATVELGANPVRLAGAATPDLRWVLPNGSGLEYGDFVLDTASLAYLSTHVDALTPALVRGATWVTLWDQVLDQRLTPAAFLDEELKALPKEDNQQNLGRMLAYLSTTYWRLLSTDARMARAPAVESVVWAGVTSGRPTTARSAFFSTYRQIVLTKKGVGRLRRLWAGTEKIPGLPISESDQTVMAEQLALRQVSGWKKILDEQEARITNPDRKARFRFVRPSLDADPAVRKAFFESLRDPANRKREPWVLEGLRNLHHPLRAASSVQFIEPALEMIQEIQRTGDVFFPGRWLDATMGGHNGVRAADIVRTFLNTHPKLPPRLRGKVLQSADMLWRSARIVHGWK